MVKKEFPLVSEGNRNQSRLPWLDDIGDLWDLLVPVSARAVGHEDIDTLRFYDDRVAPLRAFIPYEEERFAILCHQTNASWQTISRVHNYQQPSENSEGEKVSLLLLGPEHVAQRVHARNFPGLSKATNLTDFAWRDAADRSTEDPLVCQHLAEAWQILCSLESRGDADLHWRQNTDESLQQILLDEKSIDRSNWWNLSKIVFSTILHLHSRCMSTEMFEEIVSRRFRRPGLEIDEILQVTTAWRQQNPKQFAEMLTAPSDIYNRILAGAFLIASKAEAIVGDLEWSVTDLEDTTMATLALT